MKVVLLLALFVCAVSAAPMWPFSWQSEWNFVNITDNVLLNYGTYYFRAHNASFAELRVDNVHCPHFPSKDIFCRVIFAKDSNMYIYAPNEGLCCLAFEDVPATPPNWLMNATYQGLKTYGNLPAAAWLNNPYTDVYYESTDKIPVPVALSGGDTAIQWNTVTLGPVNEDHLYFPVHSCQTKCPSSSVGYDPHLAFMTGKPLL
eukprot:TRINITY_DN1226_c0_g1_i1.p1 TRINITY_DN1226_c0_g1~~TRINITY_DN1226_c0_g1_i1.p1  ORF type:complete len:203 (+),score=26.05 TRINITY_DN1226_c0_g1_i1:81-689(+)